MSASKENPRARRLGEQIQRELTELLRRNVKDDRIGNVTITAVAVTGDLRTAKVYYLVFGKQGPDPKVQKGLESAAGFLRNALSKSLMIRYTPTLTFELDTSIEHGVRLTQLIDSVNRPPDTKHGLAPAAASPAASDEDDDGHVIDEGDYVPAPRGRPAGRSRVMASAVNGILLLDKPLGVSSAGAVARVKRLFNAKKAGHTGSLDPLASGMLPICFGEATKFGSMMLDADKTYRVTVRLGERTPSADRETEVVERRKLPDFSTAHMEQALADFPRDYAQVPPMHSAIKQGGRPLYEYARAGITRERAARAIVIHDMQLLSWEAPDLAFNVRCTKGAYIRVLAEDLAAQLGTVGHLVGLRRSGVAPFSTESQWTFEALDAMTPAERLEILLPVDAALADWRRFELPSGGVSAFRQGQTLSIPEDLPGNVRIYAAGMGFLGLASIEPAGRLVPLRLISSD